MPMQPFLEEIAVHILEQYTDRSGEICLVTPNRRAGLFLRKHISRKVTKPTWSPSFLSIEDFVNRISGYQVVDNLSLMFHFYGVYRNIEGNKADPVEDFLRWGSVLLRDFDEIDSTLEKPELLFEYLQDIKYIETWNPDGEELNAFQKNYLSFFKKFNTYHKALTAFLDKQNLAYQGMSYRKAANRLNENPGILPWEKVIFAGFNALNHAEEIIINSLAKAGMAEILSDSDPYYEGNPSHEAGFFIRKYRKKWDIPLDKEKPSFFTSAKEIRVMGIARQVNQAQLAGNILEQDSDLAMNEQTAVVLANENLLVPVLNALPEKASAINITMGYPLVKTNLYGFFEALFQLYLTADRLNAHAQGKTPSFYYKDLLRFFSNTCTALLWDTRQGQTRLDQLFQRISFSNKVFYSFEELTGLVGVDEGFQEAFHFLSQDWTEGFNGIIPTLRSLSDRLEKAFRNKAGEAFGSLQQSPFFMDFEALYYFGKIFARLETILTNGESVNNTRTLWQIIRLSALETRMAFSGEPVEGLQVMGMLETRNLDFKNIILLSANEDVLPKGKSNNSFIPYEVRRKYGLQVHSDKDSVYAYHFYRLLQRAQKIYLIHDTESDGMGSSEKSRFITQLEHELPKFNPKIHIHNQLISLSPSIKTGAQEINIPKTPEIIERLSQMASNGLSPSSLNTFIRCSLKFYLEKVARLREVEEVEETIDASTLGNVVHGVLEDLYNPFIGQVLHPRHLSAMRDQVEPLTIRRFREYYPEGEITSGKNLLLFSLAKRHIENFLKTEAAIIEKDIQHGRYLTLLGNEVILTGTLTVNVNGAPITVNIKGKTDRLDKLGDTVRVVDYKTGKVQPYELKIKDFDALTEDTKYEKAFQVQAYAWLYKQAHPEADSVESGIFSLRNLKSGFLRSEVDPRILAEGTDPEEAFQSRLESLVQRILDPTEAFSQTENEDNCKYCPFQALCGRFEN